MVCRPGLAVDTCLHLLYLVTPYDMADTARFAADLYNQVCVCYSLLKPGGGGGLRGIFCGSK
jgi:hypothetical protein